MTETTPLRVRSLASGSSGNALLVEADEALIAVDCGLGARGIRSAIAAAGRSLADLDLVLVTHEHGDHISGLSAILAHQVPVYCTSGTARAAHVPSTLWLEARPKATLSFGVFEIAALPVSHDAAEPAGFRIATGGRSIVVLTDLGTADDTLLGPLAEAELVILEANHDLDMLRSGPYPSHLKRRVLSASGHLSNAECGEVLATAFRRRVRPRTVWLAHLSQTNNRPALALATVGQRLARERLAVPMVALPRRSLGPSWESGQRIEAATQLAIPGF